ncbi:MAG: response regulator transcription factor [Leptolyngbyaceae cyanobacterium SL_1_1]|nr:response regulator transcription factor [Leptolyngbyaceae cyanobacterium RM2_2_21]NJN00990.1 response regulator transcription factor [Leptolyngbyaceae cyanobacterium RM1_1_2]NJO10705.1 response regulator transcription factor [Leptolyngbyaceae cyanobacterium SL_1_1]
MKSGSTHPLLRRFLVIDDHAAILEGTVPALQNKYPTVEILTAQSQQEAGQKIKRYRPEFVVVDLGLPESFAAIPSTEVGIQLLELLMNTDPAPNIMVLSTNVKPLVRLKPAIHIYEGGFVALDKSLPIREMLKYVDLALRGSVYLPSEVRSRPEFDRRWLEVLMLKYQEGLSDKAIAEQLGISDRTIRNYWLRIQDALSVADHPQQDLRVQIQIAARKAGLIN